MFDRENPGFDAISWGTRRSRARTRSRLGMQTVIPTGSKRSMRNHTATRTLSPISSAVRLTCSRRGAFGLIATNTIGQGDTRRTGLRWICNHGGMIFAATRRKKWPGQAAVIVSVVHVHKGRHTGPYRLDEREVPLITAYLFHAGGHDESDVLRVNAR